MQTSSSRSQSSFSIKVASTSGKDDMAAMEEQAMHKVGSGTVGEARVVREFVKSAKKRERDWKEEGAIWRCLWMGKEAWREGIVVVVCVL